jgi:hypothetical protein
VQDELIYHRHLREIADKDLEYLRKKDRQYNASWKRRGGVGAFFTIVRPWDRLENMVADMDYDLFGPIRKEGLAGPDGTVIACVRDIRRYLLLVEAHMTEEAAIIKNFVDRETAAHDRQFSDDVRQEGPFGAPDRPETRVVPRYVPGTPEDGGHHRREHDTELLWPWVAAKAKLLMDGLYLTDAWLERAPGVYVLGPVVTDLDKFKVLPPEVRRLYVPGDENSMVLNVGLAPGHVREGYYPTLPKEMNDHEYHTSGEIYRQFYRWTNMGEGKWLIRPELMGWCE